MSLFFKDENLKENGRRVKDINELFSMNYKTWIQLDYINKVELKEIFFKYVNEEDLNEENVKILNEINNYVNMSKPLNVYILKKIKSLNDQNNLDNNDKFKIDFFNKLLEYSKTSYYYMIWYIVRYGIIENRLNLQEDIIKLAICHNIYKYFNLKEYITDEQHIKVLNALGEC